MATIQQTAIRVSVDALFSREGVPVTYIRGEDSIPVGLAVKTELRHTGESNEGFTVLAITPDFLIRTADLILDGANFLPEIGDRIQIVEGGVTRKFRVSPPTDQEDCWRYHDRWYYCLRVHSSLEGVV